MTEFEMAELVNEFQMMLAVFGSAMLAIVTVFTVGSIFAAHRLTPSMIATTIAIYTVWLAGTVWFVGRTMTNLYGLAGQIAAYAAAGKGMTWHTLAATLPTGSYTAALWMLIAVALFIYAATLVFFFHCRTVNLKTEAGEWRPYG